MAKMSEKLTFVYTRSAAQEIGLLVCKCGHAPNNHFKKGACAMCACTKMRETAAGSGHLITESVVQTKRKFPLKWKRDGFDFLIGSQKMNEDGSPKGTGGMVAWRIGGFEACVWTKTKNWIKTFANEKDAKSAALAWMKRNDKSLA